MIFRLSTIVIAMLALVGCAGPTAQKPASSQTADIQGLWRIVADTPRGVHEADMHVIQNGAGITGRFEGELGIMHYTGTVEDRQIRFSHPAMAGAMHFDYEGTIESNAMRGTAVFGTLGSGTWVATRAQRD